jgi:hypothetical protein
MNYNHFTGFMPLGVFITALCFAALGFAVHKFFQAKKRDKTSKRTPINWKWSFWIKDNIHEAVFHFIVLFLAVRFAPDLINVLSQIGIFPTWAVGFFKTADHMAIYVLVGWLVAMPIAKVKKAIQAAKNKV